MATLVKIMRFQIVKPVHDSWEELNQVLRDLQYDTRKVMNKTIQLCWEYHNFSSDYKAKYGMYPDMKEVLGYKMFNGYCSQRLKDEFYRIPSNIRDTTIMDTTKKWKNDLKEVMLGDRSIASFRKDVPIDLHNRSIKIIKNDNDYVARLGLLSTEYKKELNKKKGYYDVVISAKDNTQKVILDRILNGEYKASASKMIYHKKKWFINLAYKFEQFESILDENTIMGIDMGIVNPIYMAFNNSLHRYKVKGGEIEKARRTIEKEKNEMHHQAMYCGEGRRGHGTKTRIKAVHKKRNKVSNFRDTFNHKYSKYVVDMAMKHKCGTIQMENLKGINTDSTFLKNWTYFDLQQKIEYKAKALGIKVVYVNPKYTSQRCNKCGCIDKENREDQATFHCKTCGFKTLADFNASRNIAMKDIDKIIEEQLKAEKGVVKQEKKKTTKQEKVKVETRKIEKRKKVTEIEEEKNYEQLSLI